MFVYSIPFAFAGSSVKWHSSIGIPIAIGVMISTVYYGIQRIAADLIDPFGWEANDYDLGVFGLKIETETKAIAAVNPGKIETFVGPNRWKVP
jgi:predicted membrane chloride channel (bestrophin family)